MKPRVHRWMEKVQVQVAAASALALGWFVAWPIVRPWDPHGALAFVPTGDIGRLLAFAGAIWAIAACCALLTLSGRAEGALLAAMFGAAGLGLRSGSMATLLQHPNGGLKRVFALLAAETVAMGAVLAGTMLVIVAVRAVAGRVAPRWTWPPDAEEGKPPKPPKAPKWSSAAANVAGCMLIQMAVAIVALVLTFRSFETGQIAFALAGSFFLAALIAHQAFPINAAAAFWVPPLVMGVAILALGGIVATGGGPDWYQALMVAGGLPLRGALPVHWLGLGCGGALAGMWVSQRMRDPAFAEKDQ